MADIVSALSSQTGIDGDRQERSRGLADFPPKEPPPDLFSKLQSALPAPRRCSRIMRRPIKEERVPVPEHGFRPGQQAVRRRHRTRSPPPGGPLPCRPPAPDQIEKFLPQAFELLKEYLPPSCSPRSRLLLPTLATPAEAGSN